MEEIQRLRKEYETNREQAQNYLPYRNDNSVDFCSNIQKAAKYAKKAEAARKLFVEKCEEVGYICECWKRRHMSTWQMGNKLRSCGEDDRYIHVYPEIPCPYCGKLLPSFDWEGKS